MVWFGESFRDAAAIALAHHPIGITGIADEFFPRHLFNIRVLTLLVYSSYTTLLYLCVYSTVLRSGGKTNDQ